MRDEHKNQINSLKNYYDNQIFQIKQEYVNNYHQMKNQSYIDMETESRKRIMEDPRLGINQKIM